MTNQQQGRIVMSQLSHMQPVNKHSLTNEINTFEDEPPEVYNNMTYDNMISSHAGLMLIRHVCL